MDLQVCRNLKGSEGERGVKTRTYRLASDALAAVSERRATAVKYWTGTQPVRSLSQSRSRPP